MSEPTQNDMDEFWKSRPSVDAGLAIEPLFEEVAHVINVRQELFVRLPGNELVKPLTDHWPLAFEPVDEAWLSKYLRCIRFVLNGEEVLCPEGLAAYVIANVEKLNLMKLTEADQFYHVDENFNCLGVSTSHYKFDRGTQP